MVTRVFIHGLESTSRGTKGVFFRERYPQMIIEDYRGDFAERMAKLEHDLRERDDLVIVGSSYGGLMAAVFACRHPERMQRLILLAPALHVPEFAPFRPCRLALPTFLYHGRRDDIVPPGAVREIAGEVFTQLSYHDVDDDHSLHGTFTAMPWDDLLMASQG
ncbi:MAG: alpha/beta fold hydrolase [Syntrophales bacterium]|nr:alpha/beta fold hydrolase [Syntrophales bacterium]